MELQSIEAWVIAAGRSDARGRQMSSHRCSKLGSAYYHRSTGQAGQLWLVAIQHPQPQVQHVTSLIVNITTAPSPSVTVEIQIDEVS